MNLKDRLIRLGSEKPELREHIRPVLDRISSAKQARSSWEEDLRELVKKAKMDGASLRELQDIVEEAFNNLGDHWV